MGGGGGGGGGGGVGIRVRGLIKAFLTHFLTKCTDTKMAAAFHSSMVINPRRTCAARVIVLGLSVCLYSRTTGNDAAYERYQQL